jgi:hypothetical protein
LLGVQATGSRRPAGRGGRRAPREAGPGGRPRPALRIACGRRPTPRLPPRPPCHLPVTPVHAQRVQLAPRPPRVVGAAAGRRGEAQGCRQRGAGLSGAQPSPVRRSAARPRGQTRLVLQSAPCSLQPPSAPRPSPPPRAYYLNSTRAHLCLGSRTTSSTGPARSASRRTSSAGGRRGGGRGGRRAGHVGWQGVRPRAPCQCPVLLPPARPSARPAPPRPSPPRT